jgi:hypothetical protein
MKLKYFNLFGIASTAWILFSMEKAVDWTILQKIEEK